MIFEGIRKGVTGKKWIWVFLVVMAVAVSALIIFGSAAYENSTYHIVHEQLNIGAEQLKAEEFRKAILTYEEVLAYDAENTKAIVGMSQAYQRLAGMEVDTDFEMAVDDYQNAIICNENNTEAYQELSEIYFSRGKYELAYNTLKLLNQRYEKMLTSEFIKASLSISKH